MLVNFLLDRDTQTFLIGHESIHCPAFDSSSWTNAMKNSDFGLLKNSHISYFLSKILSSFFALAVLTFSDKVQKHVCNVWYKSIMNENRDGFCSIVILISANPLLVVVVKLWNTLWIYRWKWEQFHKRKKVSLEF